MEILAQEAWDYTLYRDGERMVLEVVCGTVAIYEWAVVLTEEEGGRWEAEGIHGLRFLVQAIRDNPQSYTNRRVVL